MELFSSIHFLFKMFLIEKSLRIFRVALLFIYQGSTLIRINCFVFSLRRNSDILSHSVICVKSFLNFFDLFLQACLSLFCGRFSFYHCAFCLSRCFLYYFQHLQPLDRLGEKMNLNLSRSFLTNETEKEGFEPSRRVNDLHP